MERPERFRQRPLIEKQPEIDQNLIDEEGKEMERDALKLQERYHQTSQKVEENVGVHLMDIDGFSRKMLDNMPNLPSEIVYQYTLNNLSKVYGVFFVIGILMILTVLAFTLSWGGVAGG